MLVHVAYIYAVRKITSLHLLHFSVWVNQRHCLSLIQLHYVLATAVLKFTVGILVIAYMYMYMLAHEAYRT